LASKDPADEVPITLDFFDALYSRYVFRHGPLPAGDPEHRKELLRALREGDLDWLWSDLKKSEQGSWDLIFPPASLLADGTRDPATEGWARSPLALIAWPTGGYMGYSFLPGVKKSVRLDLFREALCRGVASADFPGSYWGSPAVQAVLSGNKKACKELQDAGLDLTGVRIEWVLDTSATFTLAHVAAFSGQHALLRWFRDACFEEDTDKRVLRSFFDSPDGTGSTPLDVVVQVSKSSSCIDALLEARANPFRVHPQTGASPLSAALEWAPEVAETILKGRTKRSYQWWGSVVTKTKFVGLAIPRKGAEGLRFTSQETGASLMIEELIVASGRITLAQVPAVVDLIEAKWDGFVGERYRVKCVLYTLMFAATFLGVVAEFVGGVTVSGQVEVIALGIASLIAGQFLIDASEELSSLGLDAFFRFGSSRLDVLIAVYVLVTSAVHVWCSSQDAVLPPEIVGVDAALQIAMCWRFLLYVSVDSTVSSIDLGPFLVTVTTLLQALFQPSGLLLLALLTFANAFAVVLNYGAPRQALSYGSILVQEVELVFGGAKSAATGVSLFAGLPLSALGEALLLLFVAVVAIGTFGLVQSAVKKTLDKVSEAPRAQFQMNRMKVIASIERELLGEPSGNEVLEDFYARLEVKTGKVDSRGRGARFLEPL